MYRPHLALIAGALIAGATFSVPVEAHAGSPFNKLKGAWSGVGRLTTPDGASERMKCKAYYSSKASGRKLGLSLRCASAGASFKLKANLAYSGGSVSGSWEEYTYNAAGGLYGSASSSSLSLSISGGLSGGMSIKLGGRSQKVNVSTNAGGVRISLRR